MSYARDVVDRIEALRERERRVGRLQELAEQDAFWLVHLTRAESDAELAFGRLLNTLADRDTVPVKRAS